jgi:hypothetical protein
MVRRRSRSTRSAPVTRRILASQNGGVGKSYLGSGVVIAAAYDAHWKVTADELGAARPIPECGH